MDMSETINTIYAYLASRHISGSKDSKGRDKPFYNLVIPASNIWYRATDIDRKNIKIKATKQQDVMKSLIASILLQDYMRTSRFGTFLNNWGLTLARFGSAVVKFVDKGGELTQEVIPWNRLIVDAIDGENNPIIEMLELTPAQLRMRKGYDQVMVENLIASAQSSREDLGGQDKDTLSNYIKIYEIHGELPLSYLTGEEDDETEYVQQMHVVSFVAKKDGSNEYEDFTLVSGKEKNPYMFTHLIKEDDRTLSFGAVQNLFEAQWMVNHTQKSVKDQLDLASKQYFQTSDVNFVGRNILAGVDNGDVMIHGINQPLTQVNNSSHDVSSLINYGQQWEALSNKINSTSEAMQGQTPKSGTAWRQTEAILAESHSLFEQMVENKGLHLEDMLRTFIIPFLKRKMDTTEEIVGILDDHSIKRIDSIYIPNKAIQAVNDMVIKEALEGRVIDKETQDELIAQETERLSSELMSSGNTRYIKPSEIGSKTWKELLDGFEWDVEVDITGEQRDVANSMETLKTVFQSLVARQGQPMSEEERFIFNKILIETGHISPIEIPRSQPTPQAQTPQAQPVPTG